MTPRRVRTCSGGVKASPGLNAGREFVLVLALSLSALALAVGPPVTRAQCPQAVAAGERAYFYAWKADDYLYVNESYDERLYQLMVQASYASNVTCPGVAQNLARLASLGPSLLARARLSFYTFISTVVVSVAVLGVGAWLSATRGRGLAWRLWLIAHRRWVVERTGAKEAPPLGSDYRADPDKYPLYLAGLLVVVAVGLAGVTAFELYWRPGPFSVIALLNLQGFIGDYPQDVPPGSNVSLMVLVINRMNQVMLYRVSVAVVNSTAPPQPSSLGGALDSYDLYVVIPSDHNATAPIWFRAPISPGQYKLLLLLYYYNATTGGFYYSGLFNQLYFNVSAAVPTR
ncbi:MAG: hypothetical protein ACP5HK_07560 [Acidilobus sp.]